jgi:hypothetical protein
MLQMPPTMGCSKRDKPGLGTILHFGGKSNFKEDV